MNPTNHLSTPKRPVRRLPAFVGALHFAATSLLLVAITAGSAAPALSLSAERTVAGQITLAWSPASGRNYELLAAGNLGEPWAPLASPAIPAIATGPAIRVELAAAATTQFLRLRENKSPYDPAWETVVPLRTIRVNHDGAKTAEQNGASLKAAMLALVAGDRLEVGAGTYSINSFTTINLQGTAAAPIWIVAAEGARVVITRPDADQNLLNVGFGGPARHLCFRDLEFVGGSHGLRLYDCANVWIDRCKIRDTADVGLSANAHHTSRLHITRNEIWNTGGTGEGMYLGGNNASVIMSESIIALNHVHDTKNGVSQGDGIEVKQGSWGNLVAANLVHDSNYPCILVYGTAGMPPNIVENNICFRSNDNAMQIQGECIVRNNLVIGAGGSAFASQPHQGSPTRLTVVHNTFINTGMAVRLSSWAAGTDMVFANNACYSRTGAALHVLNGITGTTLAGNVSYGTLPAGIAGFQPGTGLADFVNVSWDGVQRDARPAATSPLRGAGSAAHAAAVDVLFLPRIAPHTTGCHGP